MRNKGCRLSLNFSVSALKSCICHWELVLAELYFYLFLIYPSICRIGLDLVNGKPRDNKQAGVFEPTMVKTKSLKFATEAAITILRIDDLIKLHPEPKEERGCYEDAVHSGALEE